MNSSAPPPRSGPPDAGPLAHGSPGPLPRVFGRYVLFDRIGRGGMADIYLARADTALGGSRLCVVKQILPELGRDEAFEKMLIDEAKLAARLTHANVVQVFDLGREGDRLYLGMEYVEGFDLNQLLRALSKSKVALPAEFAIFIVRETLRALDYAHRLRDAEGHVIGLVHRDVSPSNVLISFEGEVKLCDFGIARALGAGDESQHSVPPPAPRVFGKSAYMAPEHARGEPIDARADVFAAGILLWELAAGRRLYKGTEAEMLALSRKAQMPPLPDRGLPDPAKLQAVLDKALARFRDERFQSAAEFLRALEDYAIGVKLMASQLRFGTFLTEHFANEILELRRSRERSARATPSQVPPAPTPMPSPPRAFAPLRPAADDERIDEGAMTTILDSSVRDSKPPHQGKTDDSSEVPGAWRWNEPGSTRPPAPEAGPGKVELGQLGAAATHPLVTGERVLSDAEVDHSLTALEQLAEEAKAETLARRSSPVPPQSVSGPASAPPSEWLWYLGALLIVGAAVLAYLYT